MAFKIWAFIFLCIFNSANLELRKVKNVPKYSDLGLKCLWKKLYVVKKSIDINIKSSFRVEY